MKRFSEFRGRKAHNSRDMVRPTTTTTRLFGLAMELTGGADALRTRLAITQADFNLWSSGDAEPPWDIYQRVIETVIDEQRKVVDQHHLVVKNMRLMVDG